MLAIFEVDTPLHIFTIGATSATEAMVLAMVFERTEEPEDYRVVRKDFLGFRPVAGYCATIITKEVK
jgi:hypothetical protein